MRHVDYQTRWDVDSGDGDGESRCKHKRYHYSIILQELVKDKNAFLYSILLSFFREILFADC
jgi:hypothetical protein